MIQWRDRARALASEFIARGLLSDPRWRAASEQVPRHVFVPRFYRDSHELVDGDDRTLRAEWLDAVYSDYSLVTQRATAPGVELTVFTSSSTMPSLMARMLELLDVDDGARVLEIGTGTGYNAGLLCHRLGDANVTSIDIDPFLVSAARDRLAALGYRPYLAAGHGAAGVTERAPFDRIIATAAVPAIPFAWIDQVATGG